MGGWKLDKHVPLAVMLAIAVQTAGLIWYASKLDSRVSSLEVWRESSERRLEVQAESQAKNTELLIRLDERFQTVVSSVLEIKKKIGG
jgi:hypothetical protein